MLTRPAPEFFSADELRRLFPLGNEDAVPADEAEIVRAVTAPPEPPEPPVKVFEEPRPPKPEKPMVVTRTVAVGKRRLRIMEPMPGYVISKIVFTIKDLKTRRYTTAVFTQKKAGRPRRRQIEAAKATQRPAAADGQFTNVTTTEDAA